MVLKIKVNLKPFCQLLLNTGFLPYGSLTQQTNKQKNIPSRGKRLSADTSKCNGSERGQMERESEKENGLAAAVILRKHRLFGVWRGGAGVGGGQGRSLLADRGQCPEDSPLSIPL